MATFFLCYRYNPKLFPRASTFKNLATASILRSWKFPCQDLVENCLGHRPRDEYNERLDENDDRIRVLTLERIGMKPTSFPFEWLKLNGFAIRYHQLLSDFSKSLDFWESQNEKTSSTIVFQKLAQASNKDCHTPRLWWILNVLQLLPESNQLHYTSKPKWPQRYGFYLKKSRGVCEVDFRGGGAIFWVLCPRNWCIHNHEGHFR